MPPEWFEYEVQACTHHAAAHNCTVWPWKAVSEDTLRDAGFITDLSQWRMARLKGRREGTIREFGLDGIALDEHGVYHGIQAKMWSSTLCAKGLGTFFSVVHGRLSAKNDASRGFLYHTGPLQTDLREDLHLNRSIDAVHLPFVPPSPEALAQPQRRAIEALRRWDFVRCPSGLVQMPCGVGKTRVAAETMAALNPHTVVLVAPLKVLTKQFLERVAPYMPGHLPVLADSDTTVRAVDVPILSDRPRVIATTFASFKMAQNLREIPGALYFIDEAHNLNGDLLDLASALPRCVMLTATPPKALEEIAPVVFEYSMREAIDARFVTDYKVILPVIDDDFRVPDEVTNTEHALPSLFLASGMLQRGALKCIVYCATQQECHDFLETFGSVCRDFHGIDPFTGVITAETPTAERSAVLAAFESSEARIAVVTSVRILNEGIDVPECDSVLFLSSTTDPITAVQRMCRANRVVWWNPNKKSRVFVFSEKEKMVETMASLHHNDPNFGSRMRMVSVDYDAKHTKRVTEAISRQLPALVAQVRVRCVTVEQRWYERLESLRDFMVAHGRRPSTGAEDNGSVPRSRTTQE